MDSNLNRRRDGNVYVDDFTGHLGRNIRSNSCSQYRGSSCIGDIEVKVGSDTAPKLVPLKDEGGGPWLQSYRLHCIGTTRRIKVVK